MNFIFYIVMSMYSITIFKIVLITLQNNRYQLFKHIPIITKINTDMTFKHSKNKYR